MPRTSTTPLALILALMPLACAEPAPSEPAPAEAEPAAEVAEAEPEEPAEPAEVPGIDHTIEEGQTLWDIARAYSVSVQAVLDANSMVPADARLLRAGQTLRIPGAEAPIEVVEEEPAEPVELPRIRDGAYHHLARGETLWDVARLYDVSLDEITARNELDEDSVRALRPGQAIIVPGIRASRVERATRGRADPTERPRGFRHTVARGETVWDLASAFGVRVAEIMAANSLDEEGVDNLRAGTNLWIPGVHRDDGGRVRRTLTAGQQTALTFARRLGLGTRAAAQALLHGRVEPRWIAAASRGRRRGRTPGSLRWPIARGWFVRGFGSGEGGYHMAMDIMGRIGWNVRASAAGIVGYAGDEIPGYGNIVMVIHPGGWVTMYAHNSANSVVAGERVPAGGIIGEVGSTGISRGPHVHFEMMFDGQNCDPAPLFRPGVRHRDGRMAHVTRAEWSQANRRPEAVRCARRRRHPQSRWVTRESYGREEGE